MQFKLNVRNARDEMTRVWQTVCDGVRQGDLVLTLAKPNKTRDQEKKYHAMIGEISQGVQVLGKHYSPDIWKALLVDEFEQERKAMGEPLGNPGMTVPSLDGQRLISVRPSTRQLSTKEASAFIEFLYAKGVEFGLRWSAYAEEINAEASHAA